MMAEFREKRAEQKKEWEELRAMGDEELKEKIYGKALRLLMPMDITDNALPIPPDVDRVSAAREDLAAFEAKLKNWGKTTRSEELATMSCKVLKDVKNELEEMRVENAALKEEKEKHKEEMRTSRESTKRRLARKTKGLEAWRGSSETRKQRSSS